MTLDDLYGQLGEQRIEFDDMMIISLQAIAEYLLDQTRDGLDATTSCLRDISKNHLLAA